MAQPQHRRRSSARSSPSPSPRATSPPASVDTLVSYLVAAKRSLGCIHLVHRATTILSEARGSVESTTVLLARAAYLRRSLIAQLKILRGIQYELETSSQAIQQEFQAVIKDLDDTGGKLLQFIDLLKQTRVEEAFKVATRQEHLGGKDTLHDFVDDQGVAAIKNAMEVSIDSVQQTQHDMGKSIRGLEEELLAINDALDARLDARLDESGTESDLRQPNIPSILVLLESHAREMAQSLESLVKHFDLCVTAIKHTEGGGEAVVQTMTGQADDLSEAVGMAMDELQAPAQPMNEEERLEMLHVLENDAAEVDDVVMEIQDRNAEMEAQLERVARWREKQEALYHDVTTAFSLVDKVSGRLSGYVAELAKYANRWNDERTKIEDGIGGMEELCDHYANFLHAYDGLIVEVARRRTAKKQMERIVAEANAQLEQLYDQDRGLRAEFRSDLGEFLPSDIWSGVDALPPRYGISQIDDESFAASIPELPRKTVEDALRRLKSRR